MTQLPVALTCGEPAGIAPEITALAWRARQNGPVFFLIGDPSHLPKDLPVALISSPAQAATVFDKALPVIPLTSAGPRVAGRVNKNHAVYVIESIVKAVAFAQSGVAAAVCTNPINKKALKDGAQFPYPGHTEFLAALGGQSDVVMMLVSPQLRVVPATIHIPLSQVPDALTAPRLEACIRMTHCALQNDFGLPNPRIAIAGLNPHAGEGGAMGVEDQTVIAPVIRKLQDQGFALTGPLPADTMFHSRARATYDTAICMYHDQALIPIKTLDFDRGVNVTLGLPFVRTSPDHGTAFDIAGTGQANPQSLMEALRLAAELGMRRNEKSSSNGH